MQKCTVKEEDLKTTVSFVIILLASFLLDLITCS